MNIEITPDIIIRHGDPIAISYGSGMTIGLFRSYERSLQFYDMLTRPQEPNGLGKYYSQAFLDDYMEKLRKGEGLRQSYIYGDNVKNRVVPINMEIYKGTNLYEEYELIKEIIHEHQNYWAADQIL
jgi:hypothetical protein